MLERVKLVLIKQKQIELNKKKAIIKQIDHLTEEQQKLNLSKIDQELTNLEKQILSIQENFFQRIFHKKLLHQLYQKYIDLSRSKTDKFHQYDNQINQLLQELFDLVHDEALIEKEIDRIKNAKTLQELNLTEQQAKELLDRMVPVQKLTAIQKVFSEILLTNPTTKDEISTITRKLHQTNSSPYVLEMQTIEPTELMNQLLEIGIVLEEDKFKFLNELSDYTKDLVNHNLPNIQLIHRTDRLDQYYCNEVEFALNNMMRYHNPSSIAVSQIKTLSVLVSLAKYNKKEKVSQK